MPVIDILFRPNRQDKHVRNNEQCLQGLWLILCPDQIDKTNTWETTNNILETENWMKPITMKNMMTLRKRRRRKHKGELLRNWGHVTQSTTKWPPFESRVSGLKRLEIMKNYTWWDHLLPFWRPPECSHRWLKKERVKFKTDPVRERSSCNCWWISGTPTQYSPFWSCFPSWQ